MPLMNPETLSPLPPVKDRYNVFIFSSSRPPIQVDYRSAGRTPLLRNWRALVHQVKKAHPPTFSVPSSLIKPVQRSAPFPKMEAHFFRSPLRSILKDIYPFPPLCLTPPLEKPLPKHSLHLPPGASSWPSLCLGKNLNCSLPYGTVSFSSTWLWI